ncbi:MULTISPECIES: DUF3325 domain-containing protein [Rhodopseudomonas]|uniref:DUF3325 domain-containing protein n=1 Tax=Rhodopseudomonas palustris TaxID=1076 RepID=A0A0D7EHW6_RHOPL|nr:MULTISPECIES: DUF3325 domain-containing protein [Rhodopseudomonas]KIZ39117.1 hypothetical protein OO17_21430 [Rhodopseudomonas palustris]WOK20014.1 DUF3325 domain-containing protein [Rhodopseudomonas sp. BAL398]
MNQALAFALCLVGFAALVLATRRQQRELVGRPLAPAATRLLRAAGGAALLIVLGLLVGRQGWGLGLVMFSGLTTLAASVVYCALIGYARFGAREPR